MLITVIDGRVIPIEKSYFPVLLWRAMSGDLVGLDRDKRSGEEAIRKEINARASSINSLQILCVF
ncbi:hypothetical protein [Bacillus atrophaeus]|uniref:hypothetical protein n=1 Tax=Bacillus atrophaeus TaxID=1452 RepID=UPI000B928F6C|nr:hypothetical protein [Bacillus atrophaeus]ASS72279.1 hypothetical protein BaGK_15560 [Bacillus atrophaeus]